jgi:photosystem II stability/assembly factor-like uncharacterized protein
MRNSLTVLRAADPVRRVDSQELSANPVFDELLEAIVEGGYVAKDDYLGADPTSLKTGTAESRSDRSKPPRLVTLMTIAAGLVLLAAGLTLGLGTGGPNPKDSLPNGARITPWHAARPLPVTLHPVTSQGSATWQLVSLVVDQGWHVNTSGPPPGQLTCPTATTCYALAIRYASPKGGAQPESVSLYVSSDLGTTWSVLPMPTGFLPTSHLSCPADQVCGVGGIQEGKPAFAVTTDGGHQWGVVPMAGPDTLRDLACRSAAVCIGVLRSPELRTPGTSTSIVRTVDGGESWRKTSVSISGTVLSLSCPTDQACVAVGYSGVFRGTTATGFVLRSDDGGQSWTTGSLPQNFGFAPALSGVSCAEANACMAIGVTSIPNPRRCQGTPPNVVPPAGYDSCDTSASALISAVVTSSDGGATWESRSLPADIPIPQLYSLSCASATVCWASGQEAVPQVIGNVHDDGSPVMVGTADGGVTWSKATFAIPPDAPNFLGQAYLAIGDISCPGTSACLALGVAAQSAPSTPIYRYGGSVSS